MEKVVGFIGLGNVGYPLAKNVLRSGFEMHLNDLEHDKAKELISCGAIWHDTPEQIARSSDVVITSLPSVEAVAQVAESKHGLLQVNSGKKIWIDMSTTDSTEVKTI